MLANLAETRLRRPERSGSVSFRSIFRNGIQAGCEQGLEGSMRKQRGWTVRFGVGGFAFGMARVGRVVRRGE